MSFTSWQFAFFLPSVFLLYHLVPARLKFVVMLLASWYFYMSWQPVLIQVLLYSTFVSYAAALQISEASSEAKRKFWLIVGIALTLAPLLLFKYFNFINEQTALFFGMSRGLDVSFVLPIGISFFTFQALSYLIDVYRRDCDVEYSFSIYALYKAFFPQLVAGPIERATHLLPQMSDLARHPALERFQFDRARCHDGLRLILWGLFKKLVIADNLAVIVNELFDGHKAYSGPMLLFGAYCFAYQIYCDFSGYTDIARGCAKLFGFDLMENFRAPYRARSIKEFWQRWHISLSTWFRDYLYRPLGGNRVGAGRWAVNILLVFVLSGLWHGANWTFLIWGALHGFYYISGRATAPVREWVIRKLGLAESAVWRGVQMVITFHLVVLAWVLFRASDLTAATDILSRIIADVPVFISEIVARARGGTLAFNLGAWAEMAGATPTQFAMIWNVGTLQIVLAVLVLEFVDWLRERTAAGAAFMAAPAQLRWVSYYVLTGAILVLAPFSSKQFIYFQF